MRAFLPLALFAAGGTAALAALAQPAVPTNAVAEETARVVQNFRIPEYDDQGTIKQLLLGRSAQVRAANIVEIRDMTIEVYKEGALDARITSPHCLYNTKTRSAESTSSVRIARGNIVISGSDYTWDNPNQRFVIETNSRVILKNMRISMKPDAKPGAPQ